jgi:hypothetical protein
MVGVGGGVGEPYVDHDQLGAPFPGFGDALRMGVEVVACLQVGRDQVDHVGVGVVGAGSVDSHPQLISHPGARRAHIGMRVVTVDTPGGHDPLGEAVFAGTSHVIHHLVGPALGDGVAHPSRDLVEGLVPVDLNPLALAPFPGSFQRIEDPVGIGDLVDGGRPLGAVAAPRPGMLGVALELADLEGVPVDVGEEATRRLTVETGRGHEGIVLLHSIRPRPGVELHPVVPTLLGWEGGEMDPARTRVEGLAACFDLLPCGCHPPAQILQIAVAAAHARGTFCADCTYACS